LSICFVISYKLCEVVEVDYAIVILVNCGVIDAVCVIGDVIADE